VPFASRTPAHRILIVDDQLIPRSLEGFALEGTGRYLADEVSNAADALALLSQQDYECAIIDADMPDMSGAELIRLIRERRGRRFVPVVLVLPAGSSTDLDSLEATRVIVKPFEPWDLARLLDSLTGASASDGQHVLSVEAVLKAFPHPTMILDADHHVILANGSFYESTLSGIDECYVYCADKLHEGAAVPTSCPLDECVRTGCAAESIIETVLGTLRVSVYPLDIRLGDDRLYLHVTEPVRA
jgi:CheY-like chemotaxis protein